jgi:hypothetical protein
MNSKRDVTETETETNHDENTEEPSLSAKKQRVVEGNGNEAVVVETSEAKEKEDDTPSSSSSSNNDDGGEAASKSLSETVVVAAADTPTPSADQDKAASPGNNDNDNDKATNEKKPQLPKPLFPPKGPPDDGKDLVLDPLPEQEEGKEDDPATTTTSSSVPSSATTATTTETLTNASIVIFGLHPGITTPRLSKFLEHYGTIKVIDVKMAFASRYGICTFTDVSSAQKAMDAIHGRSILGRTIMVRPGQSSQPSQPRTEDQVLPYS